MLIYFARSFIRSFIHRLIDAFIHSFILFNPLQGYGFNPCPAELFQLYFSSFEAGIANAISSFK